MNEYVDCPICGESDMLKEKSIITCTNLACGSNGGTNFCAVNLPSNDEETHPDFPNFVKRASVGIDAGLLWIGDPCYVIHPEAQPKDIGETWADFVTTFEARSGITDKEVEDWRIEDACSVALIDDPDYQKLHDDWKNTKSEEAINAIIAYTKEHKKIWKEKNPNAVKPSHVAEFCYDMGHFGLGVAMSTYQGDGDASIYVEYGERGTPKRILIDFT